jgi:Skp family chaperone for outer membrane proteins
MKNMFFYVGAVVVGAQCAVISAQDVNASKAVSTVSKSATHAEKVGYVDTAKATSDSKEGQKKRQELEMKRTQLSTQLKKEEDVLIKQMEDFKTKAVSMSDMERDSEQKRLMKAERDLKSKVEEAELELKLAMQRAMDEIGKEIEAAVKDIAVAQNLDVVVDTRSGQVLYAKENVLYTQNLVKEMDKNYNVKVAKNSTVKSAQQTT